MSSSYPHIVRAVAEQPWALMPIKLAAMLDLIRYRHEGGRLSRAEIAARIGVRAEEDEGGDAPPPPDNVWLYDLEGAAIGRLVKGQAFGALTAGRKDASVIAVLGIYGVITQRADMFTEFSGGTSTEKLAARFRAALQDQAVRSIVFDVDSPGGGVYGVPELADEIRAARGQKPILAVSNSLMASAAYWLGAMADEVSVTPSGEAGSIGVYTAHADLSKFYEEIGEKWTLISYGKNKTEGNPFEPLSEDAAAFIEQRVKEYGQTFESAVAKGRGVSVEDVRKGFGQGRVYGAKEAVDRGMADRVETLDDAVRRSSRMKASGADAKADAADREVAAAKLRGL